jgi:hypothetical protein
MRPVLGWLVCAALAGCGGPVPTPQQRVENAAAVLDGPATEQERFYVLRDAAKANFLVGRIDDARRYADEMALLLPKFRDDWNYGNAVHDSHLVLGRIAVTEGRIDDAKQHLLDAGATPGSPQLDSFGPNMSLAQDLLAKGERDVVLAYLDACGKFWDSDFGKLEQWKSDIEAGRTPDFGANANY